MKRYVLIVAGGRGLRMGGDLPKQFIPMEGKPILMHTLETFHRWDEQAELVLVLPDLTVLIGKCFVGKLVVR